MTSFVLTRIYVYERVLYKILIFLFSPSRCRQECHQHQRSKRSELKAKKSKAQINEEQKQINFRVLCVTRREEEDDEEVVKKLNLNYHNLWCVCKKAEREDKKM